METSNRGLDLERELSCSICTEVLYQPLTLLDCLHTFCGACLKEWFGFQLNTARNNPNSHPPGTNPYTCPSCRSPVRDTKHDAKVATLLEMFLAVNPDKGKTEEEKEDSRQKYTPGDIVMPVVEEREKTLRERRVEDEDRRLMNEVQALSLRDAEGESSTARRERRRRDEGRLRSTAVRSSRDNSRDGRANEERERRRRNSENERRSPQEDSLRPDVESTQDRRRRRSREDARRRHEETSRRAARQVEHQASLRSLISNEDDSQDMQEEIFRQIQDEGLLEGVDIEHITPAQQEEIRQKIAEAYLRRQREQARGDSSRSERPSNARNQISSSTIGESNGGDRLRPSSRQRPHSRSTSSTSQADEHVRRPPRSSSAHLDVHGHSSGQSSDEGRRRRRTASTARSSTSPVPVAPELSIPSARAHTDLSNRPRSSQTIPSRPPVSLDNNRSASDIPAPIRTSSAPISQSPRSEPPPPTREAPTLPPRDNSSTPPDTTTPTAASTAPVELPSMPAGTRRGPELPPREMSTAPAEDVAASQASVESPPASAIGGVRRAPPPNNIVVPATIPADVARSSPRSSPTNSPGQTLIMPEAGLIPAPLTPHRAPTLSERATAMGNAARPTSSSGPISPRIRPARFSEPSITCSRCSKPHIEYELHYNCYVCANGNWNICLDCYRAGKGCRHWFGFGRSAWAKWELKISRGELQSKADRPHMLTASRYAPPRITEGGADGRRSLTTEDPQKRLQSGCFCCNCFAWSNHCYWKCDTCNEDDWGFCNDCVNQGKCCTHALLPLTYKPDKAADTPPMSPTHDQQAPLSATILAGPGIVSIGPFKPLTFRVSCDICHYPIQPSSSRYHCFQCASGSLPGRKAGDYDICTTCYSGLIARKRISQENGSSGWRRCLQGHRMIIAGFQDYQGAQMRVVVQDLVGGRGLREQSSTLLEHAGKDIQQWFWADGTQMRFVTSNVSLSAPTSSSNAAVQPSTAFPPDGGLGFRAVAVWSWYPKEGSGDELLFPRGAEIRECVDINTDWFEGTYMGSRALFPSPYVKRIA